MSTARYFLWLITTLMLLCSPLLFVSSLSLSDYWGNHRAFLIGFGLWLAIDEGASHLFSQNTVSIRTPILYITLALITSSLLLVANKWYSTPIPSNLIAFTLLLLLPAVLCNSFFDRTPLRFVGQLLRGTVISLLAFRLSLTDMHWHHWLFAALFSLSLSALSAISSLLPHILPKNWGNPLIAISLGLTPTTCMIGVGAGMLPSLYLLTLIGLIPMIRLSALLSSFTPESSEIEGQRTRATLLIYFTIFTQSLLLLSVLLSSQIGQVTL